MAVSLPMADWLGVRAANVSTLQRLGARCGVEVAAAMRSWVSAWRFGVRVEGIVRRRERRLRKQLMWGCFQGWSGEWQHARHVEHSGVRALAQWSQREVASCFRSLALRAADARYRRQVLLRAGRMLCN